MVDYKIKNSCSLEIEAFLRDAIQLGLDIYSGKDRALQEIKELRKSISATVNNHLLTEELKQPSDIITWNATNPTRSMRTTKDLVARTNGEPVLFVVLAHGGVAAGMDTYLRYCDETCGNDSVFYVARFSTIKLGDINPQLSHTEIDYLKEQSQGRKIILFDEDIASGNTLDKAEQFFIGRIFPYGGLIVVANLDARGELIKLGFKEQLLGIGEFSLSYKEKHEKIMDLYEEKIINNNDKIEFKCEEEDSKEKGSDLASLYIPYFKIKEKNKGFFPEEQLSSKGFPFSRKKHETVVPGSF